MNNFKEIVRNPKDFGDRLILLKQRKKLCDAEIILNGERLAVHSVILAACSEFFENEYINMISSAKNVTLSNVNSAAFHLLIDYFYTGTLKVTEQNAREVLKIANYLLVQQVIEDISKMIEKNLTLNNCISTWKFAKAECLEKLKKVSFEYCRKNFEEISRSEEFLTLEYSEIQELLNSDIIVLSETVVYEAVKKWIKNDSDSRGSHLKNLLDCVKLIYLPKELLLSESQSLCSSNSGCYEKFVKALQWQLNEDSNSETVPSVPRDSYSTLITVGSSDYSQSKTMDLFDVIDQEWVTIEGVACNRIKLSALLVNEELMLIGGLLNGAPVNTVECYDLKTGEMKSHPSMKYARYVPSSVLLSDQVFVIGGLNGVAFSHVEKWDPVSRTWKDVAPLLIGRYGCKARVLKDKIFVLGGYGSNNKYLNSTEAYNPATNEWKMCASMNEKRYAPGVIAIGGYLYAICGRSADGVEIMTAEKYDPEINKWTMIHSTGIGRYWMEAGNLMGKIVLVGGYTDGSSMKRLSTVQMYDEERGKWKPFVSLKNPRVEFKLIEIPWGLAKHLLVRKSQN